MLYTGFECSTTFLLIWGFAGVSTGFFQFIGKVVSVRDLALLEISKRRHLPNKLSLLNNPTKRGDPDEVNESLSVNRWLMYGRIWCRSG